MFVEGTSQPPPPPFILRVSLCVHLLLCAALKVWITLKFHFLLLVPPFPTLRVYKRFSGGPVLLISLHCAAFFFRLFSYVPQPTRRWRHRHTPPCKSTGNTEALEPCSIHSDTHLQINLRATKRHKRGVSNSHPSIV